MLTDKVRAQVCVDGCLAVGQLDVHTSSIKADYYVGRFATMCVNTRTPD